MKPEDIARLMDMARREGLMPELLGDANDVAAALNSQRPKVMLPGDNRELGQFAKDIGGIVSQRDLFRRDTAPVVVNADKQRLDSVTPESLRTWVETHLVCFKDKMLGQGDSSHTIQIVKTMNVDTARGTLAAWQFWGQLPEIERLNQTRLPVMCRDGRIELMRPGYFGEQRVFTLEEDGISYDETMTMAEGKAIIDDLMSEFPFKDDRSKAVAVAAMLTMFGAGMLPKRSLRPGIVYTANSTGAGKTLAAKMAIVPSTGGAQTRSFPRKEEAKKVLDVVAMEAENYVLFDNIRGQIGGEEIEAFITATEWSGRVLGESTKFRVDNVATCFFTGNDSRTTQDMQERCLFVELFVQEADSRDRHIKRVIDDAFLQRPATRSRMLSACWAMTKSWDAAGRPAGPTRLPRFEAWSEVIAGIAAHAGYGDCCLKPDLAGTRGDLQEMRALVLHLAPEAPSDREEWTFAMIVHEIREGGMFAEIELTNRKGNHEEIFAGDAQELTPAGRSYFGKFFGRYNERLFAGADGEKLRFVVQGSGNSRKYAVVREA